MDHTILTLTGQRRPHTLRAGQMIANAQAARRRERAALAAGDLEAALWARRDVRDWGHRFRAEMAKVEWRDPQPVAWMRTEGKFAHICFLCPSRHAADAAAEAAGFVLSHGICVPCAQAAGYPVDAKAHAFVRQLITLERALDGGKEAA